MRTWTRKLLGTAAVAALFTVLGAGAANAQEKISQEEMEKLFKGTTFKDQAPDGTIGQITYGTDGVIHYKDATMEDKGTYRFGEGGYCSTWEKIRTTEACFTATRVGEKQYQLWTTDGKKDDLLTLE